jgi:phage N-6-adenine-methyltransferase
MGERKWIQRKQIDEMIVNQELAKSNGCDQKDLWETPDYIFNPLNDEFGFTLDPCCTIVTRKCDKFYTPFEDGLLQNWCGDRVYCNPPYSRGNIDKWAEKCYLESLKSNTVVVALLPVSTSSNWWHEWVWKKAELRYVKGRIRFKGAKHTAPFSSVIAIYSSAIALNPVPKQ